MTSSLGTEYSVTAVVARDGRKTLIARPRSGQVRIHADCWGDDLTCQRTRAGGVYNGSPSLYDWFERTRWLRARSRSPADVCVHEGKKGLTQYSERELVLGPGCQRP